MVSGMMSNKVIVNGVDVFKELEKKEKLLELYEKLLTVKDDMLSCCDVIDDEYYNIIDKQFDLEQQIGELENE